MDVTITIPVSEVSYRTWLRTSYIGNGMVNSEGMTLLESVEVGPDQENAFNDFIEEASLEVLKLFVSRQGDVTGVPFENDGTNYIYRFAEGEPVLTQAAALKLILTEDVKNALYAYITLLWFRLKGNADFVALLGTKFAGLSNKILGNLYRLHD